MNSWLSSNHAGEESSLSIHPYGQPTSPVSNSNQLSPRRRENVVQPPPLTTSLSGPQYHGLGVVLGAGYASTPLSTTSLSSPFTQSQSPCGSTPGSGARGSSPMALRQSSSYNVPYNPRDWGPVNAGQATSAQANNMLRVVPQSVHHGPRTDMSLSPPPPPYSPTSQHQQMGNSANYNISTPGSISPAAVPTYHSPPHPAAETPSGYRHSVPRPRPLSMIQLTDPGPSRQMPLPPPPPPPQGGSGSRSSSQNRCDIHREPSNNVPSHAMGSRLSITFSHDEENLPSSPFPGNTQMAPGSLMDSSMRPPSSRRAVSAGAVVSSVSSSRGASHSRSRSPPRRSWEPGMPLPPPPPGPPPAPRSQSVSGSSDASSMRNTQAAVRTRARPPPVLGTSLGSIPPTPAGWVDEAAPDSQQRRGKEPLYIDTGHAMRSSTETPASEFNDSSSHSSQRPQSGGLFRSPAVRDTSAKGIRERRIERRHRQSLVAEDFSAASSSSNPWADALDKVKPSNLVLPDSHNGLDNPPHQASTRFTPHSSQSFGSDGQQTTTRSRASSTGLFSNRSSFSTPRPEPSPVGLAHGYAQTPPFSPKGESSSPSYAKEMGQPIPPKALPTPPPQTTQDLRPSSRHSARKAEGRPISHILHLPNDALPTVSPLSPRRVSSEQAPSLNSVVNQDTAFLHDAVQRHKTFIERETSAASESEALKIFTDFIIAESRIRRERYATTWDSCGLDVEEIRRRLFEMPPRAVAQSPASETAQIPPSRREITLDIPTSRPESAWWNNYKPCLSPIASVGMSNDEMSSRGRAPSRWWESKSSSEGGERRVQRSKRESKYMGLPRELREAMQWGQGQALPKMEEENHGHSTAQSVTYGPDEYPPEKVGWHEEVSHPAPADHMGYHGFQYSHEALKMDISRLITLPPPYPRHHPAVNNSHPDLVAYRTTVRSITDLSEIKATRQRHRSQVETFVQEHQERIQESRRYFKSTIQSQIQQGSITFAEAAEAEAAMTVEEQKLERDLVKKELDTYQDSVLKPMHAILTDRIERATACINELRSQLNDDAQHETPDQTQEEGDEKPELLEKLTQLKWLFEAREQLHREMYDLVSDRNEMYQAVVSLPYKQNGSEDKVRETTAFFVQDALDRCVQHEASALSRLEWFLDVIEENVVRGVEVQLSAFWDIAPSLLALLQKIPEDLGGFEVQIPANEYAENPSYHDHPLQYLYSLLSHAEKSSYQYIESQTNLLCLLHEVKSAVMRANCKLMEAERIRQGEPEEVVRREMQSSRADEERVLTTDLKDKVTTVECQWTEALGSQIEVLRERVRKQLMREGGWEDIEQLEQA